MITALESDANIVYANNKIFYPFVVSCVRVHSVLNTEHQILMSVQNSQLKNKQLYVQYVIKVLHINQMLMRMKHGKFIMKMIALYNKHKRNNVLYVD